MSFFPVEVEDIFMYLALGRRFWANGTFPTTDPFIFSIPDYHWHILHEWLSYLVFYFVYGLAGFTGLIVFKTILVWMACLLPTTFAMRSQKFSALAMPLMVLVAFAASHRFIERSSLFSDFFTALVLFMILRRHQWTIKQPLILSFIFLAWVNLHPAFHIGLFILCAALAYDLATARLSKPLAAATILCFIACLLNPLGWSGFIYPITKSMSADWNIFRNVNLEWQPTFASQYMATYEAKALIVLIVITAVSFGWRMTTEIKKAHFIFEVSLFIFFVWLSSSATRFVSTASFSLGILCARNIWPLLPEASQQDSNDQAKSQSGVQAPTLFIVCSLGLAAFAFISIHGYPAASGWRHLGTGIDQAYYPMKAAEVIDQTNIEGNVFNELGWGAYLAWHWDGRHKIFIHGHIDDPQFVLFKYFGTGNSEKSFWDTMISNHVRYVLLDRRKLDLPTPPLIYTILKRAPWKLVYEDATTVLFLNTAP